MPVTRRGFLKIAAGTGAAAAATAVGVKHPQRLISYVEPIDHHRPGSVIQYATTCRECPAGCGMHLWQREGRIVKAEGNPLHPVNRGALCPRGQASLQGLYDPDRLAAPTRGADGPAAAPTWNDALNAIATELSRASQVLVISNLNTGLLADTISAFARNWGHAPLIYEAVDYQYLVQGHAAVGMPAVVPHYHLDQSRFILSFAADFLETWISPIEFARGFVQTRDVRDGVMGRFVYLGPRQSMTAANADELFLVSPTQLPQAAWAIVAEVVRLKNDNRLAQRAGDRLQQARQHNPLSPERAHRLATQLMSAKTALALAGAPAAGAASVDLAMAVAFLNEAIDANGARVDYGHPHALTTAVGSDALADFLQAVDQNTVILIHNTNPAYSAPHLIAQLRKAGMLVYLGTMPDETAALAHWILPIDDPLEAWGEYSPYRGITGLQQPTMGRLWDTCNSGDILLALANAAGKPTGGVSGASFRDRLSAGHGQQLGAILQKGFVETQPGPQAAGPTSASASPPAAQPSPAPDAIELWVYPSLFFYDGRLANRNWLQEAPDPISYAAWSSWIDIHPKKALSLGLRHDDVVRVQQHNGWIEAPVRITDQVAQSTIAIQLGQGHEQLGRFASGFGANAWQLLATPKPANGFFGTVTVQKTGRSESPAYTSATQDQNHRDILEWISLEKLAQFKPGDREDLIMPLPEGYKQDRDLYPPHSYKQHRWAMVVDLNRCIGCSACTVACYAENNVPVVGKEKVAYGREMAWLKVVPYRNEEDFQRLGWIPMMCQHCDAAPCEPVCPVFASVHNEEGLNAQVYNRCIGTRYCSNNCPYKVRRFEWFDPQWPAPLHMQLNPEVSVRVRGVMEKCTFCIQRIKAAEYSARIENRKLRDGEIRTACQQTCPTNVFTFGDLMDPDSAVTKLIRNDPRAYQVLKELNTKPAVIYLKRVDASGLS